MNHKPKQMTQKVYEVALNTGGSFFPDTNSELLQKFAENIIKECARIADVADENKCEWIGGNILTHFGIKENV
jgi:hypothetical protein